jgi:hypothetical protein
MNRIQRMAETGYLPSRIDKCRIPTCQACIYGKLTLRAWRKKAAPTSTTFAATTLGQCVSVYQLESPIPGFLGQMKGRLTKQRYKAATVFVDNMSNMSYVHLQTSTNTEETLNTKIEFEKRVSTYGLKILHYHADNGRFAETIWRDDILSKGQRLTFSGVGAHHQYGRAEKKIRDLQDMARTSLTPGFGHMR